ncbi:MAG: biopolymer transporter ExbD [Planctomycetota bacterium]|nr:biopolymer transporter ExbD [Planctomycetota bacterium]
MSSIHKRGNAEVNANLTPMIDVTFLLIVFFVLVSQIVEVESVSMDLPEPIDPMTQKAGEDQRAVINIVPALERGRIEGYRLGTRLFPPGPDGIEALTNQLQTLFEANPTLAINLRADRITHYQYVEPALQAVTDAASRVESADVKARINLVIIRPEGVVHD